MKLFEWRDEAWFYVKHLWSVRAALFAAVWAGAGAAWIIMPYSWQPHIPEWGKWVLGIIGVLVAAAPGFAAAMRQPKLPTQLLDHKYGDSKP